MKNKILGLLLVISLVLGVISGLSACGLIESGDKLDTPSLTLNGNIAMWTSVENASGYEIGLNGETKSVGKGVTHYELQDGDILMVRAKGGVKYKDSDWSSPVTYVKDNNNHQSL